MKKFKGTQGNWYSNKDGNIISDLLVSKSMIDTRFINDRGILAQCYADFVDGSFISDDECFANARLMAAAPTMLDVLQTLYKLDSIDESTRNLILDTINKACCE